MIITWNERGAAGKAFSAAVKELKRRFNPTILVLVETKCSGETTQKVISKMGFKFQAIVEAQGMSGGIWVLWNDQASKITVLQQHKQFLHCSIEGLGKFSWYFTAVYASPREIERRELWRELGIIARNLQGPWLLAGDFNDIKAVNEQRGGKEVNEQKCKWFYDDIASCQLIDHGTEGPRFTWRGPKVNHIGRLYKKLDRALCNAEWRTKFGEAKVRVGPRTQSDHHPLIIKLSNADSEKGCRPFRFEAAWFTHKDFKEFVATKWNQNDEVWVALQQLEGELNHWNHNIFGHIKKK